MKKCCLFVTLAMFASMTFSCKNAKDKVPAEEVVEATKAILADDVLASLDELSEPYINGTGNISISDVIAANLTEREKLVKPDYLLDPKDVNNMVKRSQKINALAILVEERQIRKAYGMPLDETNEAIGRLCIELNAPVAFSDLDMMTTVEKVAASYKQCREDGQLPYFWLFQFALVNEMSYLISQDPDRYFSNVTEEQYQAFRTRFSSCLKVVREMAKYDTEIALALKTFDEVRSVGNEEEAAEAYGSFAGAKQMFIDSKDLYASRRAAFLK